MKKNIRKWLDIVKEYATNKSIDSLCPECNIGKIDVKDIFFDENRKISRYFRCTNCGEYNVLTLDNDKMDEIAILSEQPNVKKEQ